MFVVILSILAFVLLIVWTIAATYCLSHTYRHYKAAYSWERQTYRLYCKDVCTMASVVSVFFSLACGILIAALYFIGV